MMLECPGQAPYKGGARNLSSTPRQWCGGHGVRRAGGHEEVLEGRLRMGSREGRAARLDKLKATSAHSGETGTCPARGQSTRARTVRVQSTPLAWPPR